MNSERLLLAAGCAAFVAAVATAQVPTAAPGRGPPGPPYKNLQIFPRDVTRDQLVGNMKLFALSLGARCTHCHVGVEGQPLSTFDFASDAKPAKATARRMLLMVHRINQQEFGVNESRDFKDFKVTCFTCHRGSTKPQTVPPLPAPPSAAPAPKATERG